MSVKFQFNANIPFQIKAIQSIVQIFNGQKKLEPSYYLEHKKSILGNSLSLSNDEILSNLQYIQSENGISKINNKLDFQSDNETKNILNFTIEMETGTGKTYVYLRTIHELFLKYGFFKFIIIVPSIAIREGVIHSIKSMQEHLDEIYGQLNIANIVIHRKTLNLIRNFGVNPNPMIMIITRDSFNRDMNLIYQNRDQSSGPLIEYIQQTNPIVILDEPHKMMGRRSKWGINQLNPLIIFRFSATHREILNLLYHYTPIQAFHDGIVKKIDVSSIVKNNNPRMKKILLKKVYTTASGKIKARIQLYEINSQNQLAISTLSAEKSADLAQISNNRYYAGFIINDIQLTTPPQILFKNGIVLIEGQELQNKDDLSRKMIRETIIQHLRKKRINRKYKIKTLSLFFIDKVKDYLTEEIKENRIKFSKTGKIAQIFQQEYKTITKIPEFAEFYLNSDKIQKIHDGYFAVNKGTGHTKKAKEYSTFHIIMKEKEELLSFNQPLEFIFSHSALREGWDNPNIFNICTLSHSFSDIKKRQEIGRGLRIAVNEKGVRIFDRNINRLTLITNETYADFAHSIQNEYKQDTSTNQIIPIEDANTILQLNLDQKMLHNPYFTNVWNFLRTNYHYQIKFNTDTFLQELMDYFIAKKKELFPPSMNCVKNQDIKGNFTLLHNRIEKETNLTRKTIFRLLRDLEKVLGSVPLTKKNQENFINSIKMQKDVHISQNIQYFVSRPQNQLSYFEEELQNYQKYVYFLKTKDSLYQINSKKSQYAIFLTNRLLSIPKLKFRRKILDKIEQDNNICFIMNIPDWYEIPTPFGIYHPEYFLCQKNKEENSTNLYLFSMIHIHNIENKSQLSLNEQNRLKCVEKWVQTIPLLSFIQIFYQKSGSFDFLK